MERFDFEDLRNACSGQWAEIVSALSQVDVSDALATRKHVRCHRDHGKTKQQFRVFKDFDATGGGVCNTCGPMGDGFGLLCYLNDWDRKTATKEIAKFLENRGYTPSKTVRKPSPPPPKTFSVNEENADALTKLWSTAIPLKGTLGERYLRDRGIQGALPSPNEVRFHPRHHYWDNDNDTSLGHFPAIVSMLRSSKSGHPLSIHRIYLDPDKGKAKVPRAKKLMPCSINGAISELGAAIRLYDAPGPYMGITEGIETAMAVHSAHPDVPIWAAFSASVLTNFRPPEGIKGVYIFGDLDTSGTGQVAAAKLALRLESEGLKTRLCIPGQAVLVPSEDQLKGWYNKTITRDAIVDRLRQDGYEMIEDCENKDWLDVWNESKSAVVDAIGRPQNCG